MSLILQVFLIFISGFVSYLRLLTCLIILQTIATLNLQTKNWPEDYPTYTDSKIDATLTAAVDNTAKIGALEMLCTQLCATVTEGTSL